MGHEDWPSRKFPMFCLVWLLVCLAWALERPTTQKHQWPQTKKCQEKCPFSRQRTRGSLARQTFWPYLSYRKTTKNVVPFPLFTRHCGTKTVGRVCLPTLPCINEAVPSLNPPSCSCGECGWSFVFHLYSGIARWSYNPSSTTELRGNYSEEEVTEIK